MYSLIETSRFKKDLKRISRQSKQDLIKTFNTLDILKKEGVKGIPQRMLPHRLRGDFKKNWECHIKPDLLLIWSQNEEENKIVLIRVGSHVELFS
ncbi:MAG: type II toxin-antitoxin system YafQ family toxin [Bacteroidota bacterium]